MLCEEKAVAAALGAVWPPASADSSLKRRPEPLASCRLSSSASNPEPPAFPGGSTGEAPGKFVAIVDVPIKAASEAAAAGEAAGAATAEAVTDSGSNLFVNLSTESQA